MEQSFKDKDRKVQVIESLLNKPSKKPDFKQLGESDILKKAAAFIPQFITTTDRLLNDADLLRRNQMDIDVRDQDNYDEEQKEDDNTENMINMEIGIGVYDVLNPDFNPQTFVPSSTEPIIQVKGLRQKDDNSESSSSSSSDDEDCFYEFNSSSDLSNEEISSHTTKSTQQKMKTLLIQDITQQQNTKQKKTLKVNRKKRQRKE